MQEQTIRRVILESPYKGATRRNRIYGRACVRDCLLKGEAPIASHLLYTQPGVLRDHIDHERQRGIDAGLAWRHVADATVVYCDLGVTAGMQYGIQAATVAGIPIEYRSLGWQPPWWLRVLVRVEQCATRVRACCLRVRNLRAAMPRPPAVTQPSTDQDNGLLHR
jgi:hypothetical protein